MWWTITWNLNISLSTKTKFNKVYGHSVLALIGKDSLGISWLSLDIDLLLQLVAHFLLYVHESNNRVFPNCFHWIRRIQWQNICLCLKGLEPAASCVRDQYATTTPAIHIWETGSSNWAHFMLQWFIRFPNSLNSMKLLLHLGKTPMWFNSPVAARQNVPIAFIHTETTLS